MAEIDDEFEPDAVEDEDDEVFEVEDDDRVIDLEDGGALVTLDGEEAEAEGEDDFYANLAETLPARVLNRAALNLVELIERDREARKKRDEQYAEGIQRTGLGDEAPGGSDFEGASKVVHPVLTEVCVDFAARAIKELMPPGGPVKPDIIGDPTEDKINLGKRKSALMNWQLTKQAPEFRSELEQLLTQLPLGGGQYLKLAFDRRRNRPQFQFVAIDDMLIPFAATNFYTAGRKTHVQYITQAEYEDRVASGLYRDVDLVSASMDPEQTAAAKANDAVEGRTPTAYNEDGLRTVYEVYASLDVEEDKETDGSAPYIITVDKTTNEVLGLYRNWAREDDSFEELIWVIEFPFIPWRGAYPIGIVHMIGGLSAAATGALRALLDSAHIANVPTAVKLKGGSSGGQSMSPNPGEIAEIEGSLSQDDIRKVLMAFPFPGPNQTLFQLLGFVVDAAKGAVRTALDDTADMNPNAPVGTTLARMEQGMVVFSAIHVRLHQAMERLLMVLHRLNAEYLDDDNIKAETGEKLATRKDFQGPMSVAPVSDPNIFSEAQRFAQTQAVAARSAALPQLYNQRKVEERILETLKIPNAKDLLNPAIEPQEQNAINENVAASLGKPVIAFPEQDHIAHIKAHVAFLRSPMFGQSPVYQQTLLPIMVGHLREHIALWYASTVFEAGTALTGEDLADAMRQNKDADDKRAFDRMLTEVNLDVLEIEPAEIIELMPMLAQVLQQVQQMQAQQAPQDPALAKVQAQVQTEQAKLQIATQKAQADAQTDQADLQLRQQELATSAQLEQQKLQLQRENEQLKAQMEQMRQEREDARTRAEIQARMAMNTEDNNTARDLAMVEAATGERIAVENGTGINPNPMDQ